MIHMNKPNFSSLDPLSYRMPEAGTHRRLQGQIPDGEVSGLEYDLLQAIATAITRESSKANAEAVKVQEAGTVKQVRREEEEMKETLEKLKGDVQTVMKLQQWDGQEDMSQLYL